MNSRQRRAARRNGKPYRLLAPLDDSSGRMDPEALRQGLEELKGAELPRCETYAGGLVVILTDEPRDIAEHERLHAEFQKSLRPRTLFNVPGGK